MTKSDIGMDNVIFSDESVISYNGVFLAGPTRRNSDYSKSWRKDAVALFRKKGYDGIIYVPEYHDDSHFEESIANIHRQTDWEWEALGKSEVIMFWIPRELKEMPAFTTNVEFGRYTALHPGRVILGFPKDAAKMRYLDYLYFKMCNRESVHTLEDTVDASIELYNRRSISEEYSVIDG